MTAVALPFPRRKSSKLDDLIRWVFGAATVVTNKGKAMFADRIRTSPGTYTTSPKFMAMGVGAHEGGGREAKAADTALTSEKESRTTGTESVGTTTQTNDTYKVTGSITATSAREVDEAGLFDASSSGNMFTSATFLVDNLANGDSITFTWAIQQT